MTRQQAMFQAVCDVFEWDPAALTKSSRTRIGKVAKELVEVGATPEMVAFSRRVLDERFGTDYGPEAIALWWGEVDKRWRRRQRIARSRENGREIEPPATPEELAENRRRWREMVENFGRPVKDV